MRKAAQDIRQKSVKEINKEVEQVRSEVAKMRLEFKSNRPKDTNLLIKKRKRLAMLLTVTTEKEAQS